MPAALDTHARRMESSWPKQPVDSERGPSVAQGDDCGLHSHNDNPAVARLATAPTSASCGRAALTPFALILTTVDQQPGMTVTQLLQQPEIMRRGWSHLQMARYLEQMARGELLDARRVHDGSTVVFAR